MWVPSGTPAVSTPSEITLKALQMSRVGVYVALMYHLPVHGASHVLAHEASKGIQGEAIDGCRRSRAVHYTLRACMRTSWANIHVLAVFVDQVPRVCCRSCGGRLKRCLRNS
jgi:hypothetical protein